MKKKIVEKFKKLNSENFKFSEVIIIILLTTVVGISIGGVITKKNYGIDKTGALSPKLQEFVNNYNYILNNYYGELDETKLLDTALAKILEEIDDPYALYMDENESTNFNIHLTGSYRGIGVEVAQLNTTGELIIAQIFDNSPADKSGLKVGDIILKIDNDSVEGLSSTDFSKKIKGLKDNFSLTVSRDGKEFVTNVEIDTVIIKSVDSKILDNKIGYLSISIFADNTYEQVKTALADLEEQQMSSLIVDLRNNTGGYLTSVENILGLFLDSSHVIYQIQDKKTTTKFYSKGKNTVDYNVVILTNSTTASASEIMTAALKEELGAISVGQKTYGKGSAQKLHTMSNGAKYKFTTQKWLTPSGNSIDKEGIAVDYEVVLDEKYYDNPTLKNDNQLQTAISLLNKN